MAKEKAAEVEAGLYCMGELTIKSTSAEER